MFNVQTRPSWKIVTSTHYLRSNALKVIRDLHLKAQRETSTKLHLITSKQVNNTSVACQVRSSTSLLRIEMIQSEHL